MRKVSRHVLTRFFILTVLCYLVRSLSSILSLVSFVLQHPRQRAFLVLALQP